MATKTKTKRRRRTKKTEPIVKVEPVYISDLLKTDYLNYAVSSAVRAIPSSHDGLTPSGRRALYIAMYDMPTDKLVKAAYMVGSILKIHPHGDASVYSALVNRSRRDKVNIPMFTAQGNNGNISGDACASMRYLELKLSSYARDVMFSRDMTSVATKGSFSMMPSYSGVDEPVVLETALPTILVNGGTGLAVGMTSNIPTHNISRVIDATIGLIKTPRMKDDKLLSLIGMFDTSAKEYAGSVIAIDKVANGILNGVSGGISIVPRYHFEKGFNGIIDLVLDSVPYNKSIQNFVDSLIRIINKKVKSDPKHPYNAIRNIVDESSKDGIRIVIKCTSRVNNTTVHDVFRELMRSGALFGSENYILRLLDDNNAPKIMTVRTIILKWLEHRRKHLKKYYSLLKNKVEKELHLIEGVLLILPHINKAMKIILNGKSESVVIDELSKKFKLSKVQAKHVINVNIKTFINKADKLMTERNKKIEEIKYYDSIVKSVKAVDRLIIKELKKINKDHGEKPNIVHIDEYIKEKSKRKMGVKFNQLPKVQQLIELAKKEIDSL